MKVLMIGRATLFTHPGGDTVQLCKTAEYLNKIDGAEVQVNTVADKVNFDSFDLIHLFNCSRPADHLGTIKKINKPYVISTVYVDYSEAEARHYDWKRRLLKKIFSVDQLEYIKALGRILKGQDKLTDFSYLLKGHRSSVRKVLNGAEMLLPNSESEFGRIVKSYKVDRPHMVIPNAIDIEIFNHKGELNDDDLKKFDGAIISVGQITPVKNNINLIHALNKINRKAFIIGSPSSNAEHYYQKCKSIANDHIEFISHMDQRNLASIYGRAKVHVLASWFETTGLVSLEAAYCGCNIVVSDRGDQKEYFQDFAHICKPEDPDSIVNCINNALNEPYDEKVRKHISLNHNWELTAQKTYFAYKTVLGQD